GRSDGIGRSHGEPGRGSYGGAEAPTSPSEANLGLA
ncbi:unnamed protein product, partial [Adineta steineri]